MSPTNKPGQDRSLRGTRGSGQRPASFSPRFKPLKTERLFEQVAKAIQRKISRGAIRAGQKLPSETDLARQFGVGRSAVREALKVLELMGVLHVRRGFKGGTFVSAPYSESQSDEGAPARVAGPWADHLMEARFLIEEKTAELAAVRASRAELRGQREIYKKMEQVIQYPALFIECYVEFHLAMAEASSNHVLAEIVRALQNSLKEQLGRLVQNRHLRRKFLSEHLSLLKALERADPLEARDCVARHLEGIDKMIRSLGQDERGQ